MSDLRSSSTLDLLDEIDWYRKCLEDLRDGKIVSEINLQRSRLQFFLAIDELRHREYNAIDKEFLT